MLPLAAVCRRWHGLVGRLHYGRLVAATRLQMRNYEILLESYHPVDEMTSPSLFCEHLSTDGLSEAGMDADMAALNRLYTRFRPHFGEKNGQPLDNVPSHDIHLDSDELFSQLCTTVELVQNGPRRGLFASCAPICEHVVRIGRDYLRRASEASANIEQQTEGSFSDNTSVLWINPSQIVGLRFRVIEDQSAAAPPTFSPVNEDPPVSYKLEYQGTLVKPSQHSWHIISC